MDIKPAETADFDGIWTILESVIRAGDTYAYPRDMSKAAAFEVWMSLPRATYVAVRDGQTLGTYYIKTNHGGAGAHVCNAGYMVANAARGRGLGRALCLHSQTEAVKLGFKAMQFNLVVGTNPAVKLWQSLAFETVGVLPGAFAHPQHGYVDALVMYKWLVN